MQVRLARRLRLLRRGDVALDQRLPAWLGLGCPGLLLFPRLDGAEVGRQQLDAQRLLAAQSRWVDRVTQDALSACRRLGLWAASNQPTGCASLWDDQAEG